MNKESENQTIAYRISKPPYIQRGEVTHHQLQSIALQSLRIKNTMKRTKAQKAKLTFTEVVSFFMFVFPFHFSRSTSPNS